MRGCRFCRSALATRDRRSDRARGITSLPEKRRTPSFPKAPFISMAISRILSSAEADVMIIYLIPLARDARLRPRSEIGTPDVMRRYPRINGPAILPLFCLAPHGVFRASRITPRAVSSYLAFSTLPALRCQRTGGVFSVTLSFNPALRRGCPRVLRGMLPCGVRTFLWRTPQMRNAPAIICHRKYLTVSGRFYNRQGRLSRSVRLPNKRCGSQGRGWTCRNGLTWRFDGPLHVSIVELPRST